MSLFQGVLPFKLVLVPEGTPHATAYAGLPLVVEAMRVLLPAGLYRRLRKGLRCKTWKGVRRHLESLVLLVVAGGDCLDDLKTLSSDLGLAALLDFEISSPTQAKMFLYRFHQAADGRRLTPEEDALLSVRGRAQLRAEGPGLGALGGLVSEVVRVVQRDGPQHRATLDVDATIIESLKRAALFTYKGFRGYQPQMAWWAEQGVWVSDEFRDGNVPAEFEAKAFLIKAFGALPGSVTERRLRGDSALYNEAALTWADEQGIQFAVSADMSEQLLAKVKALPRAAWQAYTTLKRDGEDASSHEEREWAEVVDFVPAWGRNHKKDGQPLRYVAIRVRGHQRDLLDADETQWRHFSVVTNMDWEGERLLRWQREKQGTVEHAHGVLKNDLGGGTLPCGRFGANAAWWRLNVLAQNVLHYLKVKALPPVTRTWRPKALRLRIFHVAGQLARHGRQLYVKVSEALPMAEALGAARELLRAAGLAARAGPPARAT